MTTAMTTAMTSTLTSISTSETGTVTSISTSALPSIPTGASATETGFDNAAVVSLAEAVDRDGLDAHAATLAALAGRASEARVSPVLVGVMLGTTEPYVARLRAFVRVGQAVVAARPLRAARHSTGLVAA